MGAREMAANQQVNDDHLNCRRNGKRVVAVPLSGKCDGTRFRIIRSRQTAEAFARTAASSTAAELLKQLRLHHYFQVVDVVLKMVANGFDKIIHRLTNQ